VNATAAAEVIAGLREHEWIGRPTRAVFVDISCFNANTGSFLSVRLLFEFLPSGGIMPYPTLRVLRPLLYHSVGDFFRAFFEMVFVLWTLFFVLQEMRELRHARKEQRIAKYWVDGWNLLDWTIAGLSVAMILLRMYVFLQTSAIFEDIRTMRTEDEYVNLMPLMRQLQQVQNLNAVTALLLFLKVFKYLAVIPQMDILFATLRVAGLELLLFSLLFLIVVLGFAMSFYMAFGLDVHGYRTISNALLSLFQMVLGIFDYEELQASNRVLAPLLFSTFVVLVVLILMNIFLAILNDAFAVVSERQKRAQSLGGLFRNLFYKKVLRRQIESLLTEITDTAIVDGDDDLLQKFDRTATRSSTRASSRSCSGGRVYSSTSRSRSSSRASMATATASSRAARSRR